VIEDELLVRKVRGQPGGIRQLTCEHHQVETHAVALETSEALPPFGLIHDSVTCRKPPRRIRIPAEDIANPHDPFKCRLLVEQGLSARTAKRHMRDIAGCDAARLVDAFQPSGFADAIISLPAGFDMDGRDDVEIVRVAPIVRSEIIPPDRIERTETTAPRGFWTEPGMTLELQIPQVMMGIDDRTVIELCHVCETIIT